MIKEEEKKMRRIFVPKACPKDLGVEVKGVDVWFGINQTYKKEDQNQPPTARYYIEVNGKLYSLELLNDKKTLETKIIDYEKLVECPELVEAIQDSSWRELEPGEEVPMFLFAPN